MGRSEDMMQPELNKYFLKERDQQDLVGYRERMKEKTEKSLKCFSCS